MLDRMVAHSIELLTAGSDDADFILHEERSNLGGISIKELHRIIYAQVLSSHSLTWQVSLHYMGSCSLKPSSLKTMKIVISFFLSKDILCEHLTMFHSEFLF